MASINDLAAAAIASSTTPQPSAARGALIALEGLDRSGKTTQVKLLEQRFVEAGRKVKVMRFPDRTTPIGQMIDSYLKSAIEMDDHAIHLLFSANRWEAAKSIHALLASGTTIICDRYYHSGIVYSAAKQNPTLPLHWARAPEIGLPRPDIVLFLDLDEAVARERGGWGGEVYERAEMQRRVRDLFWGLSLGTMGTREGPPGGKDRDRVGGGPAAAGGVGAGAGAGASDGVGGSGGVGVGGVVEVKEFRQEEEDLVLVDASPEVEEVAEEIWRKVLPRVEAVDRGEVGRTVRTVG